MVDFGERQTVDDVANPLNKKRGCDIKQVDEANLISMSISIMLLQRTVSSKIVYENNERAHAPNALFNGSIRKNE